jgi:class 3 adenylate cyclase
LLFTDIEGSTRAWQADPEKMGRAAATHDRLVRTCIEGAGGYVFALGGDVGDDGPTPVPVALGCPTVISCVTRVGQRHRRRCPEIREMVLEEVRYARDLLTER